MRSMSRDVWWFAIKSIVGVFPFVFFFLLPTIFLSVSFGILLVTQVHKSTLQFIWVVHTLQHPLLFFLLQKILSVGDLSSHLLKIYNHKDSKHPTKYFVHLRTKISSHMRYKMYLTCNFFLSKQNVLYFHIAQFNVFSHKMVKVLCQHKIVAQVETQKIKPNRKPNRKNCVYFYCFTYIFFCT